MVTDAAFKKHLNLLPDDEEDVSIYLRAARVSAHTAGIPDFPDNPLYDLFLLELASMYYENRAMGFSGTYQATAQTNAQAMIDAFVLQLRYAENAEEVT